MLVEQMRSLKEQHANVISAFPGDTGILTAVEACMSVTLTHMNALAHQWVQAVDYVEGMLRKQLVAAIGKEVTPAEFSRLGLNGWLSAECAGTTCASTTGSSSWTPTSVLSGPSNFDFLHRGLLSSALQFAGLRTMGPRAQLALRRSPMVKEAR